MSARRVEYVGAVQVVFEEIDGAVIGRIEVCPGMESDVEMLMTLAAGALVDMMNSVDLELKNEPVQNRAARRAAMRRKH